MNSPHENGAQPQEAKPKAKPEKEDLSRWESEGGAPKVSEVETLKKGEKLEVMIERLLADGQRKLGHIRERIEKEVRDRPLVAVGIASAVGFAVGGGFRSKQGRRMLKKALRYGMEQLEQLKTEVT